MSASNFLDALSGQWPLVFGWIAYAALHSWLAALPTKAYVATHWPWLRSRYRLLYNLLSLVLIAPILILMHRMPGPDLWAWQGVGFWIANGLAALVVAALLLRSTGYDTRAFAGLAPEPTVFVISPWHRVVRHPWYFVGLVVVWTRDMNLAMLVSAACITLYFVIGSRLEEAKLIAELGERYLAYRQRVAGLIPLPWKILDRKTAQRLVDPQVPDEPRP